MTLRAIWGMFLIWGIIGSNAVSQVRLISHLTSQSGGYESQIIVENRSSEDQSYRLQPYHLTGNPGQEVVSQISAGTVKSFTAEQLFLDYPSHFSISQGSEIQVLVSYRAASGMSSPAQIPESNVAAKVWRLFPGDWTTVFDGIAAVNVGQNPADVWVVQINESGNLVQGEKVFSSLGPMAKGLSVIGGPAGSEFSPIQDACFEVWSTQDLALTALRGTPPDAPVGVLWANASIPLTASRAMKQIYRLEMRRFVLELAASARTAVPNFLIIPQNGLELLTKSGESDGSICSQYVTALDGVAQEEVYFGQEGYDQPTSAEETTYLENFLDRATQNGIKALVADYCNTPQHVDSVFSRSTARGYIAFAGNNGYDLNDLPPYPNPIFGENPNSILSLDDAQNYLYLINPYAFPSKDAFLEALETTQYDLIITDAFFDGNLSREDVGRLQVKPSGGHRLVVAYMNIGAAENWRYYWQESWQTGNPTWLAGYYEGYPDEFWVQYWHEAWRDIIMGSPDGYLHRIIQAGFDGVYLDNILAFEFFEETGTAPGAREDGARPLSMDASGSLQNPAYSPEGNALVLTRFQNGYNRDPADVLVYDRESGDVMTLVSDGSANVNLPGSCWSATTNQIVFSSSRDPHDEIFVIGQNGHPGDEIRITTRSDRMAYEPSFSPDGSRVVFESHLLDVADNGVITTFRTDGSQGYTGLTPENEDCRQPNWSPAGDLITYQKQVNGQWDIYVMAPDGSGKRRVTQGPRDKTDASFSPDGQWLVYSGETEEGTANLYAIPVLGGTTVRITEFAGYDGAPSWSPSGNEIAFESAPFDPDGSSGTTLWVIETTILGD